MLKPCVEIPTIKYTALIEGNKQRQAAGSLVEVHFSISLQPLQRVMFLYRGFELAPKATHRVAPGPEPRANESHMLDRVVD